MVAAESELVIMFSGFISQWLSYCSYKYANAPTSDLKAYISSYFSTTVFAVDFIL